MESNIKAARGDLTVDLIIEVRDVPDHEPDGRHRYAFRPRFVNVIFRAKDKTGTRPARSALRLVSLEVTGPRILAGGRLGADSRERFLYGTEGAPKWLADLVLSAETQLKEGEL